MATNSSASSRAIGGENDGLNVANPDVTTPEEVAAFRKFYEETKGERMVAHEFWIEFRPDVLKRQRARVRLNSAPGEKPMPLAHVLGYVHLYTILGFEDGIRYEVLLSQAGGATKGEILDTLALAYLHSGPLGIRYVHSAAADILRSYKDPEPMERYPAGWAFDPHAYDSGMDYSRPDATKEDMDTLIAWYKKTIGEVPRYVTFMAEHQPGLLKAYRNRLEHAIRDALPKQMLPYMWLQYNTARANADGVRESALLGRAMGMTKAQIVEAIGWGMSYGGPNGVSVAAEAAGDILKGMK
jgi:hypothetical protein